MYTGNFNSTGNANPFKFFEHMKLPEVDYESVCDACCKNVEAMSEAQKKAIQTMSAISEMQTDFARSVIQETGHFMKSFTNAKTLEEKMRLHSDAVKQGIEKSVSHGRKVAEELSKSHKDMTSHASQTWNENLKHAKETMKTSSKKGEGK